MLWDGQFLAFEGYSALNLQQAVQEGCLSLEDEGTMKL